MTRVFLTHCTTKSWVFFLLTCRIQGDPGTQCPGLRGKPCKSLSPKREFIGGGPICFSVFLPFAILLNFSTPMSCLGFCCGGVGGLGGGGGASFPFC